MSSLNEIIRLLTEQGKTLFPPWESFFMKASFSIRSLITVSTNHLRCFLSSPRLIGEVFFPKINSRARMVELTDQWQVSDNVVNRRTELSAENEGREKGISFVGPG